ncbi:amino acid adenylation domain-containing protein, partial [Bacillus spizizenii]|nr:amino acid adenylation domain-containing protein [Bacillus spizizenii]
KRDTSRNPLFDVMFTYESRDYGFGINEESAESRIIENVVNISRFDLTLMATETEKGIKFHLEYCSRLFKKETVERMGKHYSQLLKSAALELDAAISKLNMISEDERNQLIHIFNETNVEYPRHKLMHQLFEEQVQRTPEHIAVIYQDEKITYKELNEKSNSLAVTLIKAGVKKETVVGIIAEKSIETIIGMLAILKSEGAFLPIDPEYPSDRIKYMLEDSNSNLLLVQNSNIENVPFDGQLINLNDSSLYMNDQCNLSTENSQDQLAYVIYTSGTTGRPKGVMVHHAGLSNLKSMFEKEMRITERDRVIQFASFSFDASVWEISMALLTGAELHVLSKDTINNYESFKEYITQKEITVATLPPVYINHIDINEISTLRLLITAGSQITKTQLDRITDKIKYINAYGPTETTVCATVWEYPGYDSGLSAVPIGKPIQNLKTYIVDNDNNLLPIGVAGELCIAGDSLARGYLNKEDLTNEKFVNNPFESGTRMYKTGDLAKWLPDGNIEYLGRIDDQVKVRGYRIETGEIENQLLNVEGIKEAVVFDRSDENDNKYLCAYITAEKNMLAVNVKDRLAKMLPSYMIPSFIIQVKQMPLTPNGKIDKKALAAIKKPVQSDVVREAPRSYVEEILVKVWSEVLGIEEIGISDNFYELGGDSIKSILIVSKLQKYNLTLEVKDLFENPQIKSLSIHVKHYVFRTDQSPVKGRTKFSPIQKWFFENNFSEPNHFNQAFMFHVKDKINEKALVNTFEQIIYHHDALRMILKTENGEIKQEIRGIETVKDIYTLDIYDLMADQNYEDTIEKIADQIQRGMNLEKGILIKLGLFRTTAGDYLLISVHHMVIDGLSWRILLEDIEKIYKAFLNNEKAVLPLKTTSYKDWTQKLEEFADSKELKKELRYWSSLEETSVAGIPRDFEKCESVFSDSDTITVSLTKQLTEKLQRKTNAAYNTQINDLLLCALGMTVKNWFSLDKILINLEGHGREDILKNVSIDRTVGWFTSLFPVVLDMSRSNDLSYCIQSTKEYLRKVPNKGIGYGILRYLTKPSHNNECQFSLKPDIGFNYLGELTQSDKTIFRHSELSSGTSISPSNKKLNAIEINGFIINGQLKVEFNYSTKEFKQDTIKKLTEGYIEQLIQIIQHCEKKCIPEKTPSDFGDKDLSIEDLHHILSSGKEIEKIHSLTPMQNGMLYHALLDPYSAAYFEQLTFSIEGPLNVKKLNAAFNLLIEKYEVLRTAFFHEGISQFKQAVLRKRNINIHFEDISKIEDQEKIAYVENVKQKDRNLRFNLTNDCLIRVTVIKTNNNEYKLLFSFHHIIMDGWCMSLLMNDITDIYKSLDRGEKIVLHQTEPYSKYLEWLDNQDQSAALDYWKEYLNEYKQEVDIPRLN